MTMSQMARMTMRACAFLIATALAVFFGTLPARAQIETDHGPEHFDWPDTYAGGWGKAFFDAYNADGEDALRRFIKEHYSEEYLKETPIEQELADGPLMLRGVVGRIAVHSASAQGDFAIDALVKTEKFGWAKFRIELSPDPPHDLIGMGPYKTARPPEEATSDQRTPTGGKGETYGDWKDLRDLLEQVRRDSGAPGMAAAIVRRGKIADKAAIGIHHIDGLDRVRLADRWHVGSVSKTFTGTMIARLIDNGVLRWETTIGEVLHDIPMKAEYRSITLEQLLGHRGGVPSMPGSGEFAVGSTVDPGRTPAEARAALVHRILSEEPNGIGEYIYSNAGYVVAGHMAERAAKRPWEELVRTQVFEPLGLRSAGFGWPATEDRPNQPRGHYGAPPHLRVQEIGEYELLDIDALGPAGNLHCSIEDFARYAAFHLRVLEGRDDTLKAETVPRFWRAVKTGEGERMYSHFGSGGTFMAMIAVYPDSDLAVVAATNYGLPAMPFLEKMRDAIHRRLTQNNSPPPTDDDEVHWPDSIAALRAKAFVQAINADDEESLRRFVADHYSAESLEKTSIEERVAMFQAMRAQMGGFKVSSVKRDGDFQVAVVGEAEAAGMWVEFTIEVRENPPHYWRRVTALPTAAP